MRRVTHRARAAVVAALAVASFLPATGASAAGTPGDVPDPGAYQQIARCVGDLQDVDPLADGVSPPQRTLGYTRLWGLSRGAGVTVAVVDTGVSPGPAFGDRLLPGGDLIQSGNAGTGGLEDCDGHGTLVAGIIAGAPDADTGYAGVAPDATILSIRQNSQRFALRGTNDRSAGTSSTLATAVGLAVAAGASVVNVSADECGPAATTNNAALTAAIQRAVREDVVVVVAAGNLGEATACSTQNTPGSRPVTGATPANIRAALTVGSVTADGVPAEFSLAGDWVDVAAPGDQVVSTNPRPDRAGQVGSVVTPDGISAIQGTSFSAAYVSGVVALVRARFPDLTAQQVVHRVEATAEHPAGDDERNINVGYGVIDPRMALTAVLPEEHGARAASGVRASGLAEAHGAATAARAGAVSMLGAAGLLAALVVALAALAVRRRGGSAKAAA